MASVFTNVGRNWVADKMREAGLAPAGELPNRVGWGTGNGTAAVADIALFTESADPAARATATLSSVTTSVTGDTFQAVGTLTSGVSQTITNAGLFTAATGADLIMKGDHAGIPLVNGDSIQYTFKLQYT